MDRLNITLDPAQLAKLARLADRMHVQPGTLARSLLSSALDEVDPDARNVVDVLDGLPGAFGRAQLGLEQARAGETVGLDEL
jgi:hypothetical protein